ncbi:MAG: glycosyltransferase [Pseudomonadota bacterium]
MSPKKPKAAVLISTFNRPDYLREAIASVVRQKMTDWELLVMNDGGVEVSGVIEDFHDPRIRYFPDDVNRGAAYRFNFGLSNAQADYITYLGDDDLFYPNHLEVLSQALDENPEIALAYSDLYAVWCVKDEANGRRYALDKGIQVSRDFNRQFMFHYNHVLHVSLMHRRDAAFRVGCFDETVKVLIEWSLNRRLCFLYDFLHVPVVTGEYYMPIFKSDRISVVQRKNKESYRHNLRKIKGNLPEEPWTKVPVVDVIAIVASWDDSVRKKALEILDSFSHPMRLVLVNNGAASTEEECWDALGNLREIKNVVILHTPGRLDELAAYRFAAASSEADFLFLLTRNFQGQAVQQRLFTGLEFLEALKTDAVKWKIPEEKKTSYDILVSREVFLKKTTSGAVGNELIIQNIPRAAPREYTFDLLFSEAKRNFAKGEYRLAEKSLNAALAIGKGAPGIQFLIKYLVSICLALKDYDRAEKELRQLIKRGYEPDNWIRLGEVLQARKDFNGAVQAFKNGLEKIGLHESYLESPVFPFKFPKELSTFTALFGLGECYLELNDMAEAAKWLRRASKLRANSHKPFLGFAKLALAGGDLDGAEARLLEVRRRGGKKDPETHRVLGRVCHRRGRPILAFQCYLKALEVDANDEKSLDPLFHTGVGLGLWAEMKPILEKFLEKQPENVPALSRLARVHLELDEPGPAEVLIKKGLEKAPGDIVLKGLAKRLESMLEMEQASRVGPSPDPGEYSIPLN